MIPRHRTRSLSAILICGLLAACNESSQSTGQTPPSAQPGRETSRRTSMTVPSGTVLVAALRTQVSTTGSKVGDRVQAQLEQAVRTPDGVAIPAGASLDGQVTHVNAAGRVKGAAELTLRFHELVMPDGKRYAVALEPFRVRSAGDGRESAAEIGGGAAAGGILGGVLGGKGKALPGAAIGAILGTGVAVATKGDRIILAPGQRLRLAFVTPVEIVVAGRR